jgi:hypothetical protein
MVDQFAKMEENEFLVRNFNRILEILSELVMNDTFQEFILDFKNTFDNMESNFSSNLVLFKTQLQDNLMLNLNPIINSLSKLNKCQSPYSSWKTKLMK